MQTPAVSRRLTRAATANAVLDSDVGLAVRQSLVQRLCDLPAKVLHSEADPGVFSRVSFYLRAKRVVAWLTEEARRESATDALRDDVFGREGGLSAEAQDAAVEGPVNSHRICPVYSRGSAGGRSNGIPGGTPGGREPRVAPLL
jgi:hypothetical protein